MRRLSEAELLAVWDGSVPGEPPHARLGRVLASALPGEPLATDTLGRRNQRLIALHADLVGGPIAARAACVHCHTDNEFEVPADAIAAAPAPTSDARATLDWDGARIVARLPTMADLDAVAGLAPSDARGTLLAMCANALVEDEVSSALAEAFEALDPAAVVRLSISCAGCDAPLSVDVDLAAFVEASIEARVEVHLSEIDIVARAYGWSEAEILALSPARRARYVARLSGEPSGWLA